MADGTVNRVWVSVERGGYSHGQLIKFFAGGDSTEEVQAHLEAVFGRAAADNIFGHVAALGTEEAFDNLKSGGVVTGDSAPASTPSSSAGPVCQHGARVYKESKPGAAKAWKAWMCSARQGDPSQCAPEWLK